VCLGLLAGPLAHRGFGLEEGTVKRAAILAIVCVAVCPEIVVLCRTLM
jgi:hypothetical protein